MHEHSTYTSHQRLMLHFLVVSIVSSKQESQVATASPYFLGRRIPVKSQKCVFLYALLRDLDDGKIQHSMIIRFLSCFH